MRRWRKTSLLLSLILAVTVLPSGVYAEETGEADGSVQEDIASSAVPVSLNSTDHTRYMNGSSDGLFHPDSALTRSEAAQIIYSLLDNVPEEAAENENTFGDVTSDAWYAPAVNVLSACGIMQGSDGQFRPSAHITRAEFITMLSNFYPEEEMAAEVSFSDVTESFWGYDAVIRASQKGWITGYSDGTFRPNNTLTRAEAAVILNRVLGRNADSATIGSAAGIRLFPDLDKSHWAYEAVMEAAISHEYSLSGGAETWTSFVREKTVLSPGTHVIDGILYRVSEESGDFVRNAYVDGHWYDANGRYITGNAELDSLMRAATRACTSQGMTQHQMLQAAFNYMVNNYTYLTRPILATGAVGWTEEYAVPMFQKHKGNCYSFAAAYYYLAKNIGYNPREVAGLVGHNRRPHGWIEIDIAGNTYIYDTELTMAKRRDGYNYYLFEMTYRNAPFVYSKR